MSFKFRYLIITLLILIIGGSAYALYSPWDKKLTLEEISPETNQENWFHNKNRINILLLGVDEDLKTNSRTDTIIMASLDTKEKKVSLLSIPRDTKVDIPGYGENRINAANFLGGVSLTRETVSNLLRVPIDHHVITNFSGFKGIVDTLGGVQIDVEQNMKYRTYNGMIDLKKGLQTLDGDKSLQYVRFRRDKLGDISRTQRQQKFLVALAKEMMQAKTILKLPGLIPKLNEAADTDLSIPQMVSLAKDFGNYDFNAITVQTLPGNFVDLHGASYWYVDQEKAHQTVMEVFLGKSINIIDDNIKTVSKDLPKEKITVSEKSAQPKTIEKDITKKNSKNKTPENIEPEKEIQGEEKVEADEGTEKEFPLVIIEQSPTETLKDFNQTTELENQDNNSIEENKNAVQDN